MDFDAICKYCGEKLPHEKCSEARKKPEPGEFTKKACDTMNYSFKKNNPSRDAHECRKIALEACDEIDRLTLQNTHAMGLNKVLVVNAQKSLDELKAKDEVLRELLAYAEEGLLIDEQLAAHIEQALKEN